MKKLLAAAVAAAMTMTATFAMADGAIKIGEIGPLTGAAAIYGTAVANGAQAYEDRVFMLTPSASSSDVTADKDNVYQVCFTDPAQGTASAQYIAEHKLAEKVAVIYNNADAYSTGIYQTFDAEAKKLGLL